MAASALVAKGRTLKMLKTPALVFLDKKSPAPETLERLALAGPLGLDSLVGRIQLLRRIRLQHG